MADFDSVVRPSIEQQLQDGETLEGLLAANHMKTFGGKLHAVGVTDRRLILQPLGRGAQPDGPPLSITPEALASADVVGAGSEWWNISPQVIETALTVKLRTTDGQKMKLMFMKGGGGMFGALGGGEAQQQGVTALIEWMKRRFA